MKEKILLKRLVPLIAVLLLAPWPIAFTYDSAAAAQEPVHITAAEPSAAPSAAVFGKAISGIKPGDLFYIDTTNQTYDITVTLSIANAQELIHNYRYVILKVGVYFKDNSGQWAKATLSDGRPVPDTFISLQNGQVSFSLAGGASYKLTLDSGSLNCITAKAPGGSISPQLHLEVN